MSQALDRSQKLRAAQFEAETRLESARTDREKRRAEVVSLEALQKAALGRGDARTTEWLARAGLEKQPRPAAQLAVRGGWERAGGAARGDPRGGLGGDGSAAGAEGRAAPPVGRGAGVAARRA